MSNPAGDYDYDTRGAGYTRHRRPDPRIAAYVHAALGPARQIINVGAGAGSYEPLDREVTAVEPSAVMRGQRPSHLVPAVDAVAQRLPFPDDSFDAAMAMITIHQWTDRDTGLRELRRVARGPVVIMTADGEALSRFWLGHYAPELLAVEAARFPTIDHVCDVLGGSSTVTPVPIPIDCVDGFGEAFYARPEAFLDESVRAAQSGWGFIDDETANRAVAALHRDLDSGEWDRRFGTLRTQPVYTGSICLITAYP
ncbi:MAG TPA: class I SAM-dependent methyltransferase [Mycobacteriales bacterium]|jgi:SAM-dependent methyltransferase|nr:class I SAM-dependent methyltransferase [Mycobacteriales bacterium]